MKYILAKNSRGTKTWSLPEHLGLKEFLAKNAYLKCKYRIQQLKHNSNNDSNGEIKIIGERNDKLE